MVFEIEYKIERRLSEYIEADSIEEAREIADELFGCGGYCEMLADRFSDPNEFDFVDPDDVEQEGVSPANGREVTMDEVTVRSWLGEE